MRTSYVGITATFLALLLTVAASAKTTTKHSSSPRASSNHPSTHNTTSAHNAKHSSKKTASTRSHGQRTIGEDRTRQIQSALIREHYLTGEPSGVWDPQSKEAMMRYQAANGWQTRSLPDSRALIKLGLGPDHKNLLNPDTAAVSSPHELGVNKEAVPGGSASQP